MSSKETDQADRRQRDRAADAALSADRAGRDRLRQLADEEVPSSHREDDGLPNTSGGGR